MERSGGSNLIMKLSLEECVELARKKEPFRHRHVFGEFREGTETIPPMYGVFLYTQKEPLYVYDYEACQWYGVSTLTYAPESYAVNMHKMFRPRSVAHWVKYSNLLYILENGYVNYAASLLTK